MPRVRGRHDPRRGRVREPRWPSCDGSRRHAVRPGRSLGSEKSLLSPGRRKSASISSVLIPCCAYAAAQFSEQKLFPSSGIALVNSTQRACSSPESDSAVRRERNASACADAG